MPYCSTDVFDLNNVLDYATYSGTAIKSLVGDKLTYNGVIFKKCVFSDVDMSSKDILSCIYDTCNLVNVNYENTDYSTNKLTHTELNMCVFDGATVNFCEFGFCVFNDCTFKHTALTGTIFRNCQFNNIHLVHTTTYNNKFDCCTFTNCTFENSVSYNIFNMCTFKNTATDIAVYTNNLIYKSEMFGNCSNSYDSTDIVNQLSTSKQYIPYAIYRFNENSTNFEIAFLACIAAIIQCWKENLVMRVEQIDFITALLEYGYTDNKYISTVTVFQCIRVLQTALDSNDVSNNYVQSIRTAIIRLYMSCLQQYNDSISKIQRTPDVFSGEFVYLDIVYENKPAIDLATFLNSNMPKKYKKYACCVFHEEACYHEVVKIFCDIFPFVEGFLKLLVPLATIAALSATTKADLRKKKEAQSNVEEVKKEKNEIHIYNTYNVHNEIHILCDGLIKNNIVCDNDYQGYTDANVRSITIYKDYPPKS